MTEHPHCPAAEFATYMMGLFGSKIPERQATRLYRRWLSMNSTLKTYPTAFEEVQHLSDHVSWEHAHNLSWALRILDPCSGTGMITSYLQAELHAVGVPVQIHTNDLGVQTDADTHLDAMLPTTWRHLPRADVIVTSPPFELADIIIPKAVEEATLFTAIHIFGDFLTNGPTYRRKWWANLQAQGRTAQIHGLPLVTGRPCRRCIWLLVFATSLAKRRIWLGWDDVITITG